MKCRKKSLHIRRRDEESNFSKTYMPFRQNESRMFCLIGDLPVCYKSLILEP